MEKSRGSQKQIAQRYQDQVDYRKRRGPWRRTRIFLSFLAIVGGSVALFFGQKKAPDEFFNTGPLSSHHSALESNCAACHQPNAADPGQPALEPVRFLEVLGTRFREGAPSFAEIDRACQSCHKAHSFHAATVEENRSCSACHKEHQGPGPMHQVTALDCAACHNDNATMRVAAQRGRQLSPWHFRLNPKVAGEPGRRGVTLQLPRPPDGYTATFASFNEGHPPFQLHRENVRDPDTLRFNHQLHLNGAGIPPTKEGGRLDCNYCHQPQADGRYMKRVSFEANCQSCHSLQFDVKNPDFQLPHGDSQLVRTFLRTLPAQYGEFARRARGLTSERQVVDFTALQIKQLLGQYASAGELERAVFFAREPYQSAQQAEPATRAQYAGCAYCHEVKPAAGLPAPSAEITKPVLVDRWMPHAHFNHAKHETVASCVDCHGAASGSRETSEVLLPTKESCVSCHRPEGQAKNASSCSTCHTYHAPDLTEPVPATASAGAFKRMLVGTEP